MLVAVAEGVRGVEAGVRAFFPSHDGYRTQESSNAPVVG
jgi:hypothetical protein